MPICRPTSSVVCDTNKHVSFLVISNYKSQLKRRPFSSICGTQPCSNVTPQYIMFISSTVWGISNRRLHQSLAQSTYYIIPTDVYHKAHVGYPPDPYILGDITSSFLTLFKHSTPTNPSIVYQITGRKPHYTVRYYKFVILPTFMVFMSTVKHITGYSAVYLSTVYPSTPNTLL